MSVSDILSLRGSSHVFLFAYTLIAVIVFGLTYFNKGNLVPPFASNLSLCITGILLLGYSTYGLFKGAGCEEYYA